MKTSTTIAAALLILSAGSAQGTLISFSDATGEEVTGSGRRSVANPSLNTSHRSRPSAKL